MQCRILLNVILYLQVGGWIFQKVSGYYYAHKSLSHYSKFQVVPLFSKAIWLKSLLVVQAILDDLLIGGIAIEKCKDNVYTVQTPLRSIMLKLS